MKIIEGQNKVDYFGLTLYVPEWVRWIATDKNGQVYMYDNKPNLSAITKVSWGAIGEADYQCQVDLEGMDWRDTLMEVK